MKFKHPVYVKIYFKEMLAEKQNFLKIIEFFCEKFPEFMPEKFGYDNPINKPFSTEIIETIVEPTKTVWFKKNNKNKYICQLSPSFHGKIHSSQTFDFELEKLNFDSMINYVMSICNDFDADLAIIDMNKIQKDHPKLGWHNVTPMTYELKHWLPDMYWGMVFGKIYVDLFGLENLLSIPAFMVKQLQNGSVFVQLTSTISDVFLFTNETDVVRERVKSHLSSYAFFDDEKAYCRSCFDILNLNKLSEPNLVHIESQTEYTDVFQVPHFKFVSDKFILAQNTPDNIYNLLNTSKKISNQNWSFEITQNWLLREFSYPSEDGNSYRIDVDEFIFFLKPDGYDAPVEKELFFTAADRADKSSTNHDFVTNFIDNLKSQYSAKNPETSISSSIAIKENYVIGKFDIVTTQELCKSLIFTRIFVFDNFYVKVTFMDYWCENLKESIILAENVFNSFKSTV